VPGTVRVPLALSPLPRPVPAPTRPPSSLTRLPSLPLLVAWPGHAAQWGRLSEDELQREIEDLYPKNIDTSQSDLLR